MDFKICYKVHKTGIIYKLVEVGGDRIDEKQLSNGVWLTVGFSGELITWITGVWEERNQ